MQLIRRLKNWPDTAPTVITIGNFDGVHRGHQAMFAATRRFAEQQKLPATVISFEPLPHEYFKSEHAPPRLQGLRDRVRSIEAAGIDRLLLLSFNNELAAMSADQFVSDILVKTINARHMVIGDDFRFGYQRMGTFDTLHALQGQSGYTLEQSPSCLDGEKRISSTSVRENLLAGNLDTAAQLLGRPYRISGRVIHGEKVGRQLGFPTANVSLGKHRPPLRGVFAVQATHIQSGTAFAAVANLGERPTIGGRKLLLEVHALDQSVDWYGEHLAVDFMHQIRHEKRFDSLDELKTQIALDADAAREMLKP